MVRSNYGGGTYGDTTGTYDAPPPPRTPFGRNPTPTQSFRTVSGPNGDVTTSATHNVPFGYGEDPPQEIGNATVDAGFVKPIQVPLETGFRLRNEGIASRRPSPQFRNTPLGQQRFGPIAPAAPAPIDNQQQAGQQPAAAGGNQPAGAGTPRVLRVGSLEWKRVHDKYTKARDARDLQNPGSPEFIEAQNEMESYKPYLGYSAPTQSNAGGPPPPPPPPTPIPAGPAATTQPSAQPTRAIPTPLDEGERQKRIAVAEDSAEADLQKNPSLGTTPVEDPQIVPGTVPLGANGQPDLSRPTGTLMTPMQAEQAVHAGPEQTARNVAATQRGVDARRAGAIKKNSQQFEQNRIAGAALNKRISARGGASTPARQPAAPTAQPSGKPAGAVRSGTLNGQRVHQMPDGSVVDDKGQRVR